jgi:hypothetical protein
MFTLASIVDWKALWETAVASVVAGLGVTLAASVAIYGFASFAEARRDERSGAAAASVVLAVVASLAFAGAIGVGLVVMIRG